MSLWSQSTALLARQSVGLSVSDSIFVQKSFLLIPNDTYAYIVVHGSGKTFKCLEGTVWNNISELSLANRIASNKSFHDKTIVLLSCGDTAATQNLTNALALLDQNATPKRAIRSIIGWDGEVEIYSNGYIQGTGTCRKFSPLNGTPILLLGTNVPKGSGQLPFAAMPSVILMNQEGTDIGTLVQDKKRASEIRLLWRTYKFNFLTNAANTNWITDGEINNAAIFKSWLYVRVTAASNTKLTGDAGFMISLYKVLNQGFYKTNGIGTFTVPNKTPVTKTVQEAIKDCVVAGSAKKITIDKLAALPANTTAQIVIDLVAAAGVETPLQTYLLTKYLVPATVSHFDKNLFILEEKFPDFAEILNEYVRGGHNLPL